MKDSNLLPPSEIYQRYYGFMLGFLVNLLRMEFAAPRFDPHRRRIADVLTELDVTWDLPSSHASFCADEKLQQDLLVELKLVGRSLADFYAFGHSALQVLVGPEGDRGRVAARTLWEVVAERQLERAAIEALLRPGWDGGLQDEALIAELMSRAYDLAVQALVPVPKEERTCFVIMPFAAPFRDYYRIFYRAALRLAGYESIRAWEGLTNEHYLQMVFTLLIKCGAALADLTPEAGSSTPNPNVIHEVGMNMGTGNVTYLLRQDEDLDLPSNFIGLPFITYDPGADDWPAGQSRDVARALREVEDPMG